MCIDSDVTIGTLPTDDTYWIPLTLRGAQGASGTGLSPRGGWSSIIQYYTDDCVAYNNALWQAKRDNLNAVPQDVSDDWQRLMALEIADNSVTAAKLTNDSVTTAKITNNAVTNAKIAQMATKTLKGNNTTGTANTADLTVAQVKTMMAFLPADVGFKLKTGSDFTTADLAVGEWGGVY